MGGNTTYVYVRLTENQIRILAASLELMRGRAFHQWPRPQDVKVLQRHMLANLPKAQPKVAP
jgi:hypothetical protein